MTAPRIAVGPRRLGFATDAVVAGGGTVVGDRRQPRRPGLARLRRRRRAWPTSWPACPTSAGCSCPFAGVERVVAFGLLDHDRIWTCAKGSYAEPVAEHALMLALAGLRHMPTRVDRPIVGHPGRHQPLRPAGDHPRRRRDHLGAARAAGPLPGRRHRGPPEARPASPVPPGP